MRERRQIEYVRLYRVPPPQQRPCPLTRLKSNYRQKICPPSINAWTTTQAANGDARHKIQIWTERERERDTKIINKRHDAEKCLLKLLLVNKPGMLLKWHKNFVTIPSHAIISLRPIDIKSIWHLRINHMGACMEETQKILYDSTSKEAKRGKYTRTQHKYSRSM